MNRHPSIAILTPQEPRAVPFDANAPTFYAYRVVDDRRTLPLVVDCASLEEAVERAKVNCLHKEHLLIREVGGGTDKLHLYAIKRKAQPKYVYRDYAYDRVHELYAAPVCIIDMRMLGISTPEVFQSTVRDGERANNASPVNK